MSNRFYTARKILKTIVIFSVVLQIISTGAKAQMRQVYEDIVEGNKIYKISFYSPSEGYIAFRDWIGYTTDSGRTFTKKFITLGNVDFGTYTVNITFGFGIEGVKAFNQNTIIVYGDYGLVPAILYSNNGGNSFTLIYHSQYNPNQLRTGILDMIFPQNSNVGYAVDADRILKSVNGGLSWSTVRTDPASYFTNLEAPDDNTVFAFSVNTYKVLRTTNAGTNWQAITLPVVPQGVLNYAYFLTANTGWVAMYDDQARGYIYKTTNAGANWTLQNNLQVTSFSSFKMKFLDNNTGYALHDEYSIYKTEDGGMIWEPLPRDNNYTYLSFSHTDLYFYSNNQFWAGGRHGFLEITTNGGGTPLPKAYFRIDTTGLAVSGNVSLLNYSRTGYTYQWFVNNTLVSTSYNASYTHDIFHTTDTVKLIVSNGTNTDTAIKYHYFYPPVIVSSFSPTVAAQGNTVTITGLNFTGANSVSFGGVAATSYTVNSSTTITATVGAGASGSVRVTTPTGVGSLAGFTFLPPPTITSFTPTSAAAGETVTITGTNFVNVSAVKFANINAVSFVVVSSTTITAVAPSGPSGSVSVTTAAGTASLSGYSSLPTITSFTPLQGTHGTIMTITGTSLLGTTGITVGGIPVLSFTVNSATSITAVVGAGASGAVVVIKPGGSSSLPGFTWYAPPVITSFSPISGPVGTVVTISGSDFDATPANNTVYFGAMRATVTGGNSTSIIVTVPVGATFNPITVVSNYLIAYSAQPFLVTFPDGGSITANSFAERTIIPMEANVSPVDATTGDLDGDGKTDMIITNSKYSSIYDGVYLYRNTSTLTTISFDNPVSVGNFGALHTGVADLDGDGKLDLFVTNVNTIAIFRNNSSPGNISFIANGVITGTGNVAINDVDGDGKSDVATTQGVIYRNVSEPGSISFAAMVTVPGAGGRDVLLTDLDGDSKPELVFSSVGESDNLSVLKNNCTKGNISFGAAAMFPSYTFSTLAAGDIDSDGRTDVIISPAEASNIFVYRNTTNGGTITFAPVIQLGAYSFPDGVAVSDLDGDGRLDIAAGLNNYNLTALKNTGTPSNISFAPNESYIPVTIPARKIAFGDINGDGKTDALVVSNVLSIHLNKVLPEPFVQSFTPTIGNAGTTVTITGNNFSGVTAVSFGGVPAASFVVNSATSITAVVGAGANGDVVVTNNFGSGKLAGYVFDVPPVITNFSPSSGPVNTTVTITGENFDATIVNNRVYFGSVEAKVLTATSTTLTVTVPFGSIYSPIRVTTHGLTAYTALPFTITFPGASSFNPGSFASRYVRTGFIGSSVADIDGDGKPDLVGGGMIIRNTSLNGNFSFADNIPVTPAGSGSKTLTDDIDGDGKPDLTIIGATLSIRRNTSSAGAISFIAGADYSVNVGSPSPSDVAINDLDKDGKPDVVVATTTGRSLSVFRNTSNPGSISMAVPLVYPLSSACYSVLVADLDNDGRPELVASTSAPESFCIFHNTSLPGNISFVKISIAGGTGVVSASDVDNDGKLDIVWQSTGTISVHRNTSTVGNISFAAKVDFPAGAAGYISHNDIDGDGKPEMFLVNSNKVYLLKNNSSPGVISLSANTQYEVGDSPGSTTSADMDGDGRADIINFHLGNMISILRNQIGGIGPCISSYSPAGAVAGDIITLTGSNFNGVSQVSFGGVAASSFNVISSSTITAVLDSGASGEIIVKTPTGMGRIAGFTYGTSPVITSVTPLHAVAGTLITITGSNFTNATAVKFGGTNATSFTIVSHDTIKAVVGSGQSGDVVVTNPTDSSRFPGFLLVQPVTITSFSPMVAYDGYTITINGTNFTGTTQVTFANIQASSFTVVSPTVITAIVPTNCMTGDIVVTTPEGSATISGFYYGSTSPFVTSFYPVAATTGMTVLITGRNLGRAIDVQFGGVSASSFSITSPTTISAVVGNGASGNVSIVIAGGGANNTPGFTFIPAGNPVITSVVPSLACTGATVTISGVNLSGATAVSFGGTAASSFTVVSPTTITAIVGNGSSGIVSLTTPSGTNNFPGFVFTTSPVITSFSPVSAVTGATVIIDGSNFSSSTSSNTVYFGSVKAVVTNATSNSLSVIVPSGAIYGPLSVTVAGLTGYSRLNFLPTYNGMGSLNPLAFATRVDSASAGGPSGLAIADIDTDGKPDLTVANYGYGNNNNGNLRLYTNGSINGTISFSSRTILPQTFMPQRVNYADFNGDGKIDLVTSNNSSSAAVDVYANTSTPGTVIFGTPLALTGGFGNARATTSDLDGDGKADIAFVTSSVNGVYIRRNSSSGSTVSFDATIGMTASGNPSWVCAGDLDSDGKPDLVVSSPGTNSLLIFRNTSTIGSISFSLISPNITGTSSPAGAIGDVDGDGKNDIVMGSGGAVIVLRNVSVPGYIQFEPKKTFTGGNEPYSIALGDIDGNGKVDVIVPSYGTSSISILSNKSTPGVINFDPKIDYPSNAPSSFAAAGDMDADGQPDIVLASTLSNSISILKNMQPSPALPVVNVSICTNTNVNITSSISGTTYQWQRNTGSGFVNLSDNADFSGTNSSSLQITGLLSSWYGYQFRCVVDGNYSSITEVRIKNTWTGAFNSQWENPANWSCGTVPDNNTDVIIGAGTIILSSNTTIRMLTLSPGVNFAIDPGYVLTITH